MQIRSIWDLDILFTNYGEPRKEHKKYDECWDKSSQCATLGF